LRKFAKKNADAWYWIKTQCGWHSQNKGPRKRWQLNPTYFGNVHHPWEWNTLEHKANHVSYLGREVPSFSGFYVGECSMFQKD
jgi:hypothetical protein